MGMELNLRARMTRSGTHPNQPAVEVGRSYAGRHGSTAFEVFEATVNSRNWEEIRHRHKKQSRRCAQVLQTAGPFASLLSVWDFGFAEGSSGTHSTGDGHFQNIPQWSYGLTWPIQKCMVHGLFMFPWTWRKPGLNSFVSWLIRGIDFFGRFWFWKVFRTKATLRSCGYLSKFYQSPK